MESNVINDYPILDLFLKLREAGLPLMLNDYQLILDTLVNPAPDTLNLESWESITQLCQFLWVKSQEQNQIFQTCLEEVKPQFISSKRQSKSKSVTENVQELITVAGAKVSNTNSPTPSPTLSSTVTPSDLEEDAVKPIGRITKPDDNYYTRFRVKNTYFPADFQQMRQSWLTLNSPEFGSIPTEIDIDGTIADVQKNGIFFQPVLIPPRQPTIELLLLIDRQGSMVPFHSLGKQLKETAVVGHFGNINCYYFENYPDGEFYRDPECYEGKGIKGVLSRLHPQRTAVLIFSDGGAARGKFNLERFEATEEFLRQIKPYSRTTVWLNPMPKERWEKTTAIAIASLTRFVTMFECHQRGFAKAIAQLQQDRINLNRTYIKSA
ncbi:hypothetical protein BCD67_18255 [Oscillatoriales cyanobacterium USR001]|nr:hypothetical protein BCD67_18255 [Oscillatoriales cyanobacterium USR001]